MAWTGFHSLVVDGSRGSTCMHALFAEPQASVGPRLSDNKVGSKREVARAGGTVSLVCAAQASPAPFFRFVSTKHRTVLEPPAPPGLTPPTSVVRTGK